MVDRKSRSPARNQPAKDLRRSPQRKDRKRSASTSSSTSISQKRSRPDDFQKQENRYRENRDGRDGGRNNRGDYGSFRRSPEVRRNTESRRTPDRRNEAGPSSRDAKSTRNNKRRSATPDNRQTNINERSRSRNRSTSRGRPLQKPLEEATQKPKPSSGRVESRPQHNVSHSPVHKPKLETNSTKTEKHEQNEVSLAGANPFRKKSTQKEAEVRSHTPPATKPRDHKSSSKSSSLSYSPARRSPDRYKDIADRNISSQKDCKSSDIRGKVSRTPSPINQRKDQRKLADRSQSREDYSQKERNAHPIPVVRLRASSESETEIEKNDHKSDETAVVERTDENQKDKRLLEALPGIAAKAKEKIKTISNAAVSQTTSKANSSVSSKAIDLSTDKQHESGSGKLKSSTPSPVRSNEKAKKDDSKIEHDSK